MLRIDGAKLVEFIDKNKKEPIPVERLRKDVKFLISAGIPSDRLSKAGSHRELEYFLLRTNLYSSNGKQLSPYQIQGHWDDFCKSWIKDIDGVQYHLPFYGRVNFSCRIRGRLVTICHPEASSQIEAVHIDEGALTSTAGMGKDALYKRNVFSKLLEQRVSGQDYGNIVGTSFGKALVLLNLARIINGSLVVDGERLLFNEMIKNPKDNEYEKAARVILRREHEGFAQVSSVIAALENFERQEEPFSSPTGTGEGRVDENQSYYQRVEWACSFDNRVSSNALTGRALGFAPFGAMLETYHRYVALEGKGTTENYAYLSWLTDSLAHFVISSESIRKFNWPTSKTEKTLRHNEFIRRHTDLAELKSPTTTEKGLEELKKRLPDSEVIDFNLHTPDITDTCISNVFITSKAPIKIPTFKEAVILLFQNPSKYRDSQGAFYYPDFRFVLGSKLGLALRNVDELLAYSLSDDRKFRERLWFFPAFGEIPKRDQLGTELMATVMKPFDSINLNF